MFCPQCGKECKEGYVFCLSCGSRLVTDPTNQNTENNLYSQDFESSDNAPLNSNMPFDPTSQSAMSLNTAEQGVMSFDSADIINNKNSSSVVKRGIIIAVVALLTALLGIFAFMFIRNKVERDYLTNNPSKYVFSSYQTYFDNTNQDDNDLFAVLKNCQEQGSIKFSTKNINNTNTSADVILSYNHPDKKYYFKMNGENIPAEDKTENALAEFYTDINRIDFDFDINGKQGKYYIESGKIREQASNSIFSPDNDNVLNIDKEQFDQFITQFENFYRNFSSNNSKTKESTELYEKLLKKIEQDCKVTIEDGTTTVNGKDVSVDIITYTLDYNAIIAILNDLKSEFVNYYSNSNDTLVDNNSMIDSINNAFDNTISFLTDSDEAKSIIIKAKNYTRKDNKEIAKLEIQFNANESTAMNFSLEFSHDPYMNIKFTVSSGVLSYSVMLYKEINGGVVSYVLSADTGSNSSSKGLEIARVDYDDNNNKLTFTVGGQSYSCNADVSDNKITLNFGGDDTIAVNIEISSEPQMNTINADKNLFDISINEFEEYLDLLQYAGSYPDNNNLNDYYEENYEDYNEDYNYSDIMYRKTV